MLAGSTRASDETGTLRYASNAMLERVPGTGNWERDLRKRASAERERGVGRGGEGKGNSLFSILFSRGWRTGRKRGAPRKRERKREENGRSKRGAS